MTIRSLTPDAIAGLVVETLRAYRFSFQNEKELQAGVHDALSSKGIPVRAEVPLGKGDIVDFVVADIVAVECKIRGSAKDVTAQLIRYAKHPSVEALVLVSSSLRLFKIPRSLRGKPVRFAAILRGLE